MPVLAELIAIKMRVLSKGLLQLLLDIHGRNDDL
jgi:hypothetical protein